MLPKAFINPAEYIDSPDEKYYREIGDMSIVERLLLANAYNYKPPKYKSNIKNLDYSMENNGLLNSKNNPRFKDPLDLYPNIPYLKSEGNIFQKTDFYLRKTNKNSYYCVVFTDNNIEAETFYNDYLLKFNNLPKDNDASLNHFNTIQNWFIVNSSYLKDGTFAKYLQMQDYTSKILLLIGFGNGAKHLWKYLLLNKLPIIFLDPVLDEQDLEYYKSMSDKQRNMTIINSNSNNWNSNKQTKRLLKIIENNYQNFDNSLIKQPDSDTKTATHNLLGQPLFNNDIIIKAYDAVLNTTYYRDKVQLYDLSDNRYKRRYNN